MLCASGFETFGDTASPLYEVLQQYSGPTRVMLLHPNKEHMHDRARSLNVNVRSYRKAIIGSQARLRELRRRDHAVDGRFYDGQANWKLLITSRTAWVQYYEPTGRHVQDNPIVRFDITEAETGLYHLFHMEFDRLWQLSAEYPMKLEEERRR
jgi:hypothetical protein